MAGEFEEPAPPAKIHGPYLQILSRKTQLRLKRTNSKLLICHGCRRELKIGDEVIFAAGAMRKRYCRDCANRYQIVYTIPDELKDKVAPLKEEESTAMAKSVDA